jgi:hypothetical protein
VLDTVYDRVIPPVFPPIVKEPVHRDLFDIIEPDHFYAPPSQHGTTKNDQTTRNKTPEDLFAEGNIPGASEREDDMSGEFECMNTCQCESDEAGNEGPGLSGCAETMPTGTFIAPPSLEEAQLALKALKFMLRPPRTSHAVHGGYKDPKLDPYLWTHMKQFLWTYINPQSTVYNKWTAASLHTANYLKKKPYHAQLLWERVHAFMEDLEDLSYNPYGAWSDLVLDHDETLAQDIHLHLQKIRKYVRAEDLVDFMDTSEMWERKKLDRRIAVSTAQR